MATWTGASLPYEPLAVNEIRLLYLKDIPAWQTTALEENRAGPTAATFTPEVTLRTTTWDKDLQYYAISYMWGDAAQRLPLIVNGQRITVTANLRKALGDVAVNMGPADGFTLEDLPVWIDALCINQADIDEKSVQVRKMGLIYTKATFVLVSIAQELPVRVVQAAFNIIWELAALSQQRRWIDFLNSVTKNLFEYPESVVQQYRALMQPFLKTHWDQLWCLEEFARPEHQWWESAWVVQEVALRRIQETLLLSGLAFLEWSALEAGTLERSKQQREAFGAVGWQTMLNSVSKSERDAQLNIMWSISRMESFLVPIYYNRRRSDMGFPNSLANLLHEHRIQRYRNISEASVPHDIIYSLLAMSSDRETCGIVPDYRKTFPGLCRDVAVYLLQTKRSQAFQCCGYEEDDQDVTCSWSFNWAKRRKYSITDFWWPSNSDQEPLYNACGTNHKWWFQDRGLCLSLRALLVDEVQDTARFSTKISQGLGRDPKVETVRAWIDMFEQYLDSHPSLSKERRQEAWRVPIADLNVNDEGCRADDRLRDGFDKLRDGTTSVGSAYDALHTYAGALSRVVGGAGNDHISREVFITKRGYVGLGVPNVKVGDYVHIIAGGNIPLILRSTGQDQFRIIGEAFVEGIMEGEAVSEDVEFEQISII